MITIECRHCGTNFDVPKSWIIHNGRVFCPTCCKSYEVRLGEEDLPPPIPDKKIEDALVEIEKSIDKAIEEYEIPETDDYSWF